MLGLAAGDLPRQHPSFRSDIPDQDEVTMIDRKARNRPVFPWQRDTARRAAVPAFMVAD
jgi:hypothetical protein